MTYQQHFTIGTQFIPQGRKHARLHTVVDVWKTFNSKGELVRIRYVATHETAGQTVTDYDVGGTTIAMGMVTAMAPVLT